MLYVRDGPEAANEERGVGSWGGGGQEERRREGERKKAGVSTHHAPGISYLKFSRSAPQKTLPTLPTRTHQGARFEDALRGHSLMREAARKRRVALQLGTYQ